MALTNKLKAIADAIRGKTGKTEEMTLDQMATEIAGIQAGGGDDYLERVLTGTITEFNDNALTSIRNSAFRDCKELVSVNLPSVISAGTEVFLNCTKLETVNLPNATSLGNLCFSACSALKNVYIPKVNSVGSVSFRTCSSLESVILPALSTLPETFYGCTALAYAEFGAVTRIIAKAFSTCSGLKTVVIRTASVCALDNVTAFAGTPFASGGTGGTVYVPSALIESYKTATNWSTLYADGACNFVAIEGSEYE